MTERPRAPIALAAVRIGRADLGAATIVIHEEGITLTLQSSRADRPIRIPHSAVNLVGASEEVVALTLRDSTRVLFACDRAQRVRDELLLRARSLPEVTRALRALGSTRGERGKRSAAASDQLKFFAPLLEARRNAVAAGAAPAIIGAFDAASLAQAIGDTITGFVTARFAENGPERRALEAELTDIAEPLIISLHALAEAADWATASIDDLRRWRQWAAQVRATFEVADRVWVSLDTALDSSVWKA